MKKKIAFLIPDLKDGGAERVVSNLSFYLSKKYNLYVVLYDGRQMDYPIEGVIVDLKVIGSKNYLSKLISFLKRLYKVGKIKKEYKFNATISFLSSANIINLFTNCGEKKIISVRNFKSKDSKGFHGQIYKILIKLFYSRADEIIAVSEGVKKDLIDNFGIHREKIKVIYNPYDIEEIQELSKEAVAEEYREIFNHPVTINVGRLNYQKGQWHMIRAFKKVKKEVPEMKLVILGKGELEKYLLNLVNKIGLEEDVIFLGFQRNPFKFISKSTIFILPSLYEGFPNALVEAMVCGVPVISSDCQSGPREILAPNTEIEIKTNTIEYGKYGILLPVCDGNYYDAKECLTEQEEILAKSIVNLYFSKETLRKYTYIAQERIKSFCIDKIVLEYESLLNDVLYETEKIERL